MPTFEQSTFVEVDVTPQEFLDECTEEDLTELVQLLKEEYPEYLDSNHDTRSIGEQEYEAMINALHNKWNMLSSEEEEAIRTVAKRFL